jgi:hypothetical protein
MTVERIVKHIDFLIAQYSDLALNQHDGVTDPLRAKQDMEARIDTLIAISTFIREADRTH